MFWTSVKVGFLLGLRQVQRANVWVTVLVISIMMLTFLFLTVLSGILVGIIEGGNRANRSQYTGDVIITSYAGEQWIEESRVILDTLATIPFVDEYSGRYLSSASIEANYKTRRDFSELPDQAGTQLAGIDIVAEDDLSGLSSFVVEGDYLEEGEEGYVLLGSNLLRRYSSQFGDGFDSLDNVYPGDSVKITTNGRTKEFTVKGIVDSKVGEVSIRAFIPDDEFKRFVGRSNLNVNEIAITRTSYVSDDSLKNSLVGLGFDRYGKIQTATEAIPQFLVDIEFTFRVLGNVFGLIGLIVAGITIFIIVFINAITRSKYIGILKAIGIERRAIEYAYVFQSLFYAIIGSGIGVLLVYLVLVPLFARHPLDFPFSDGVLVAPFAETFVKLGFLFTITVIAGFVPAWIITHRNTLKSILGR